jgi:hypothetical protein
MPGASDLVAARRTDRSLMMLESFPGLFLVFMIVLTLVLLPYLNDDRQRTPERTGRTEELHIKPKREPESVERKG